MPRAKQAPEEQNDLIARIESYDQSYYISRDGGSERRVGDEAIIEIRARIERIDPKNKRLLNQAIDISFVCARTFATGNEAGSGAKPVLFSVNNRAENSHLPFRRREHVMLRFRQTKTLQKFVSIHASIYNHFNSERHLIDRQAYKIRRSAALTEWQNLAT